jgi:hypothetical protein
MVRRFPKSVAGVVGLVAGFVLSAVAATASGQTREAAPQEDPTGPSSRAVVEPAPEAAYNPEFCEILEKWNSDKKIPDPDTRGPVEGEYSRPDDADHLKTWKVETACGEFLVAVPLWADVAPLVLSGMGENLFEDSQGATWDFQTGEGGVVTHVVRMTADGSVSSMNRVGDSRTWGDPHENLNGKTFKDWQTNKK